MKQEIDLTQRNDFSSGFRHTDGEITPKKYKHKTLPWERAGEDELAPRLTGIFHGSFNYNINGTTTFNDVIDLDDDSFIVQQILEDEFGFDTRMITNRFSTNIVDQMITYASGRISSPNSTWNSLKRYYVTQRSSSTSKNVFPCGHKLDIIEKRQPEEVVDKYKELREGKHCCVCGRKISILPWRKPRVAEKHARSLWSINEFICESCYKEEQKEKEIFVIIPGEEPDVDFEQEETLRLMKRWKSSHQDLRSNSTQYSKMFGDVPCISSNIEMDPRIIESKHYPKGYKDWDYMDDYETEQNYQIVKRHMSKDLKVYYKGKGAEGLRRREEPWQPHGRVSQPYDRLFDRMDWREMLRHAITGDESPIVKGGNSTLSTINNTINDININDGWLNFTFV